MTAALAVVVAALMLTAPATSRSLAADAATIPAASPIISAIASARDDAAERAAPLSRSLGAGRAAASGTDDVASPPTAPVATTPAPTPTPPPPPPAPTVEDARSFAFAQIGPAQFSCLDALWQHESDWNPAAQNPASGAYGIAQALPGAKMASVGDDWMSNPVTQVSWGLEYIDSRYGSACNAWSFWLNHYPHWY